jgi:hypothetical protein
MNSKAKALDKMKSKMPPGSKAATAEAYFKRMAKEPKHITNMTKFSSEKDRQDSHKRLDMMGRDYS